MAPTGRRPHSDFRIQSLSQPHAQVNVLPGNTAVADQIHALQKCCGRTFAVVAQFICRSGKKAMVNFQRAATLDDDNAQTYQELIAQIQ